MTNERLLIECTIGICICCQMVLLVFVLCLCWKRNVAREMLVFLLTLKQCFSQSHRSENAKLLEEPQVTTKQRDLLGLKLIGLYQDLSVYKSTALLPPQPR